jgi:hypothetical protein
VALNWNIEAVSDFNGDGSPDLVIVNSAAVRFNPLAGDSFDGGGNPDLLNSFDEAVRCDEWLAAEFTPPSARLHKGEIVEPELAERGTRAQLIKRGCAKPGGKTPASHRLRS